MVTEGNTFTGAVTNSINKAQGRGRSRAKPV